MNNGLYLTTGLRGDRKGLGSTTPAMVKYCLGNPGQVTLIFWKYLEAAQHAVGADKYLLVRACDGADTAKADITFARCGNRQGIEAFT